MTLRPLTLGLLTTLTLCTTIYASDYNEQMLEEAHQLFRSATNSAMYAEAAKQYEYLIKEEKIYNGHLFYTLGNCWLMAGHNGKAILNYRRSKSYIPGNPDLQYNLQSARALCRDLIEEKPLHPLAACFLGWHFDTSPAFRWRMFSILWIGFWGAWIWMIRSQKRSARTSLIITGVLSLIILSSLIAETVMKQRTPPGVIIEKEVLARKGNGEMYAPAFLAPLHSGTEFRLEERRGEWWKIRLADGQTCWIPASTAETIALAK